VTDVSSRVDSNIPTDWACAAPLLESWASANALLAEPADFSGIRERERFTIALNLAAAKLTKKKQLGAEVVRWLDAVSLAVARDFSKRNVVDNLYVWSGVAAESGALLSHSKRLESVASLAWQRGVQQINPDGTVPSELRRQNRALLYHLYYLSALLILHSLENADGISDRDDALKQVHHLADRVESGLCSPQTFVTLTGLKQDDIPASEFIISEALGTGIVDSRMAQCGKTPKILSDPILGGSVAWLAVHAPP
jgi:poly(beta-D-mannuronate) lyase